MRGLSLSSLPAGREATLYVTGQYKVLPVQGEVQCVDYPTGPREFDALMAELDAPVLVKGVTRDWAASRTWSPQYLSVRVYFFWDHVNVFP